MYDTVWALAIAMDKTQAELNNFGQSFDDFQYGHRDNNDDLTYSSSSPAANITNILAEKMKETNFIGVSVCIGFYNIFISHFIRDMLNLINMDHEWQRVDFINTVIADG
jgi:hypothetical protein